MEGKRVNAAAARSRLDGPSLDEFRKAQLKAKIFRVGIWRDYIATASERAEWKRLREKIAERGPEDGSAGPG